MHIGTEFMKKIWNNRRDGECRLLYDFSRSEVNYKISTRISLGGVNVGGAMSVKAGSPMAKMIRITRKGN